MRSKKSLSYRLTRYCKVKTNVSGKSLCSIGIGGKVKIVCYPQSVKQVKRLVKFLQMHKLKYFVVGFGSNCVIKDGEILGMAGASADSDVMWQIGIDVMPESKGRNLGPFITILLKREILKRGKIPYYGTVESHIQSQKVAVKSGFVPYWAEINSAPLPEEKR